MNDPRKRLSLLLSTLLLQLAVLCRSGTVRDRRESAAGGGGPRPGIDAPTAIHRIANAQSERGSTGRAIRSRAARIAARPTLSAPSAAARSNRERTYMYVVSLLGGLWAVGRFSRQWRFDRARAGFVPRDEPRADERAERPERPERTDDG